MAFGQRIRATGRTRRRRAGFEASFHLLFVNAPFNVP